MKPAVMSRAMTPITIAAMFTESLSVSSRGPSFRGETLEAFTGYSLRRDKIHSNDNIVELVREKNEDHLTEHFWTT